MNKIVYVSLCLILSSNVFSQDCEYIVNGKNEMTGIFQKILSVDVEEGTFLHVEKNDSDYSITLHYSYVDIFNENAPKEIQVIQDGKLIGKTKESGDIILKASYPVKSETIDLWGMKTLQLSVKYKLTAENVDFFINSLLKELQLELKESNKILKIKGKNAKKIQKAFFCIKQ